MAGRQIIIQPDGLYAIFSNVVDGWVLYDCTAEDVIDYFVSEAAEAEQEKISVVLDRIQDNEAYRVYEQFTLTFEEADAMHRDHFDPINFEYLKGTSDA